MARKRNAVYVAPVGQRLEKRAEEMSRLAYLANCFRKIRTWIPSAPEPDTLTWSDPLEAKHKERFEKLAVEEEHGGRCRVAFVELLSTWQWPELPDDASYVMGERLLWAERLCLSIEAMPRPSGCEGATHEFPWPKVPLADLLVWIAFDLYDHGCGLPKKWWDGSSFEDYYDY